MEENYEEKLNAFVEAVCSEKPDIIALQEVNQTCKAVVVPESELVGFIPCDECVVIRRDNHAYNVVKKLRERGVSYYWTWLGMKLGYDKYDEGMALMSLRPIVKNDVLLISGIDDYHNWKTRKIIGICTKEHPDEWFYSVHYGWWDDIEEPFQAQWERTDTHMKQHDTVWLLGDFNSPAEVRGEGYDRIVGCGWQDSYLCAEQRDAGITVDKVIDGWKEKVKDTAGMRIDQIWCNKKPLVKSSAVIFNGTNYQVVSDHYGIIIAYER